MKKLLLLPLFIFCIGIFVSSSSIVNAYTWEDMHEFVYKYQGTSDRTTQNTTMSLFAQYWEEINTSLDNSGISPDNYSSFQLKANKNGTQYYNFFIIFTSGTTSYSRWNSNSQIRYNNTTSYLYVNLQNRTSSNVNTGTWSVSSSGTGTYDSTISIYDSVGLYDGATSTFLTGTGIFAQNYFNAITSNNITITNTSTTPFLLQSGLLGLNYDYNNISYKLYSSVDIYNQDLTAVYTSGTSGYTFHLYIDYLNLINTGQYKINMYNNGTLFYTSDIFTITKSRTPQAR